eukprot:1024782-Pleurochrysis_carterae.AAC.1
MRDGRRQLFLPAHLIAISRASASAFCCCTATPVHRAAVYIVIPTAAQAPKMYESKAPPAKMWLQEYSESTPKASGP